MTGSTTGAAFGSREFAPAPERIDGFLPLRGYALLGDGRSCALVGCDGDVDWWALPTMADDPTFGAVLDPVLGGRLTLQPVTDFEVTRSYVDGGAVLETVFRTSTGIVRVTDALNLGGGSPLPWSELARRIEAVDGEVRMRWEVQPGDRFTGTVASAQMFGSTPLIEAGGQRLALILENVDAPEQLPDGFAGSFTARPGTPALLAVSSTDGEPTPVPTAAEVLRRLRETTEHWAGWRHLFSHEGPWADAVARSAIVHKQLTLASTGALQGAATTSLPEKIGGSRNMDYRFSWVRDTGFALDALTDLGLRAEVHGVLSYLLSAVARTAPDVQAFYTMAGTQAPAEIRSVPLWSGYRHSSPVRKGNNAASQKQLGAYGDLLEALWRYTRHGNVLDDGTGELVSRVADQVCTQWVEEDAGLWELPQTRPYTSSKIGCWAALDRAVKLARAGMVPKNHADGWAATAEEIRSYIDEACWSGTKGSYTFYAGTDELDCATLLVARTGFSSGEDPRLHSTIDAIRRELSADGPLLFRYTGMRGKEGAFVACSFWLVEALAIAGRLDEAHAVMDDMVACANDVGLLSEEVDPDTGELLGNLPQALSHLALINAATVYSGCARQQ